MLTKVLLTTVFASLIFVTVTLAQKRQVKQIALYPSEKTTTIPNIPSVAKFTKTSERPAKVVVPKVVTPLSEYRISSGFGWRKHPVTGKKDFHNGIDLAARAQVVRSVMDGKVESTGYHKNLGNYVRIDHGFAKSIYGHLSRITVSAGQHVSAGYPIVITGTSGRTTGEHLHFSIRRNNTYIDPSKFLRVLTQNEH